MISWSKQLEEANSPVTHFVQFFWGQNINVQFNLWVNINQSQSSHSSPIVKRKYDFVRCWTENDLSASQIVTGKVQPMKNIFCKLGTISPLSSDRHSTKFLNLESIESSVDHFLFQTLISCLRDEGDCKSPSHMDKFFTISPTSVTLIMCFGRRENSVFSALLSQKI